MKKIQGAVVGLGYWGPNLVRNFLKIPSVHIKTVCDTSPKNLRSFTQTYPHIPTTNNFQDILTDPQITFVAISTPLKTHYVLAKQALLAGKHVLIEKPMTSTAKEAKELIAIAKKQEKIIMVGYTFVYSNAVAEIKKLITKNNLGKLLYYDSTRINLGRFHADTNVIWDLAPHDLSILHYLLNDRPKTIQVLGSPTLSKKTVDVSHIFLTYVNNFTAHIHVSWLSPVKIRNILISGSKKMVIYDDIQPSEKLRVYNSNVTLNEDEITPLTPIYRSGNITIPHISTQEALFNELQHFITCIKTNTQPVTDGYAGLKIVQLLEAADESLLTGKSITLKNE